MKHRDTTGIVGWIIAIGLGIPLSVWPDQTKVEHFTQTVIQDQAGRPLVMGRSPGGTGYRTVARTGTTVLPVVIVAGTPYEMGFHLGRLMREEIRQFIPPALAGIREQLQVSLETLQEVWYRMAAYTDDRIEQELIGLAEGCGLPLRLLQAVHTVPLLMPYSCSSIAAWGQATADGHLYQTRNLDWDLGVGAHNFPVIVLYFPIQGCAHVLPTFAGMIGAHTGLNVQGIVLAEMGDSPAKERPYDVQAPHFTTYFRTMLYDANSLHSALDIFRAQPQTKRYHFVFGDGQHERRAVKIRAHTPEPPGQQIVIWTDNDPTDEYAPQVMEDLVYNDEERGAFPLLKQDYGKLNAERMIHVANQIPIKGGNVMNAVYDATALKLWVAYARDQQEAYLRPYVFLDLTSFHPDQENPTQ